MASNIPAPAGYQHLEVVIKILPAHIPSWRVEPKEPGRHASNCACVLTWRAWRITAAMIAKQAAKALGAPFFDEPPPSGPGARARDARKMVDWVWISVCSLKVLSRSSTLTSLKPATRARLGFLCTSLCLLSGLPGVQARCRLSGNLQLPNLKSMRSSCCSTACITASCIPRCQSNMKTEMALRTHLRKGLSNASPDQRASIPNIRLPKSAEEAKLHYKPGPSEEWCVRASLYRWTQQSGEASRQQEGTLEATQRAP